MIRGILYFRLSLFFFLITAEGLNKQLLYNVLLLFEKKKNYQHFHCYCHFHHPPHHLSQQWTSWLSDFSLVSSPSAFSNSSHPLMMAGKPLALYLNLDIFKRKKKIQTVYQLILSYWMAISIMQFQETFTSTAWKVLGNSKRVRVLKQQNLLKKMSA